MSDTVITAENIAKRYRIGVRREADTLAQQVKNTLLYPLHNFRRIARLNQFEDENEESIFWALRNINFSVKRGEVLGIIGHNGAGKSTLLKILSKITEPTKGEIRIKGRVSSLLEVGTGFHPELTGRDNIYMNGTILGMSKKEIDRKFDVITAFSGVEKHIDTPVKFYSSGMKVRLGFSVAAHLEPEILIIDEVLAVGDLAFQNRCLRKMDDVSQSGRTVLFVSHNMAAVEGLCSRCLVLNGGRITFAGNTAEGVEYYRNAALTGGGQTELQERTDREGSGNFRFERIRLNEGNPVVPGQSFRLRIEYTSFRDFPDLQIAVKISRGYRDVISVIDSKMQGQTLKIKEGRGILTVDIPTLPLIANIYTLDLWAGAGTGVEDKIFNAARFTINDADVYGTGNTPDARKHGFLLMPECSWNFYER